MAVNVIEAVLQSRLADGVTAGMERTKRLLERDMADMANASRVFSGSWAGAMGGAQNAIAMLEQRARVAALNTDNALKSMSLAGVASALALAGGLVYVTRAAVQWGVELAREASEVTELRLAYEGLIASTGRSADLLQQLKAATEGLVGTQVLLQNTNRVLGSQVPVTDAAFVKLAENVFALSKVSGVDGARAMDILTDALIKGNTRGFQAVGIHLNVRDAVSEMAAAMGQKANTLAEAARMQGFYNELLEETSRAAALLPAQFVSVDDAITRIERTWRGWFVAVGEGILRSRVFQEVLQRLVGALNNFSLSSASIEALALSTNAFFVSFLQGSASTLRLMGALTTGVVFACSAMAAAWRALEGVVAAVLSFVVDTAAGVLKVFSLLPGRFGEALGSMSDALARWAQQAGALSGERFRAMWGSFDGADAARQRMVRLADGAEALAAEMVKLTGETVRGTGALQRHSEQLGAVALDQKKVNAAMKEFRELMDQIRGRGLDGMAGALEKFMLDMRRIDQLDLATVADAEDKKRRLREAAMLAFLREQEKLRKQAAEKELQDAREQQELLDAVRSSQTLTPPPEFGPRNLGDDPLYRGRRDRIIDQRREWEEIQRQLREMRQRNDNDMAGPLIELMEQMERLNRMDMNPFHQIWAAMKVSVADFAAQAGQAFVGFFADLVSGQEGAGRKLLAAFLGMIGQMVARIGVMLMQAGLAEIILAQTLVGRLMGASVVHGLKALAVGGLLAATGGVLQGASALAGGTASQGSGASFQRDIGRPISEAPRQIVVGRPGAAGSEAQKVEVLVRLEPGLVAKEVKRAAARNDGSVRFAVEAFASG